MDVFSIPEIAIRILESCDDFSQLLVLASACKRLHSVWRANTRRFIWRVGLQCMPAFNEGLIAVRATYLVKDALESGMTPPHIAPLQLSGVSRKPDISEVKAVVNLEHLVRCVEHMYLHGNLSNVGVCGFHPDHCPPPSSPREMWRRKSGFYRSMYRMLIAGAVFAKAYSEPFLSAPQDRPPGLLRDYLRYEQSVEDIDDWEEPTFTDRDLRYLEQFIVYDFEAGDAKEQAIFGPFAEWLIEDVKGRAGSDDSPICPYQYARRYRHIGDRFDDDELAAIWEFMQLVAACENFRLRVINGDGTGAFERAEVDVSRYEKSGGGKQVPIIQFGVFRVEELSMPTLVEDSATTYLIANPSTQTHEHDELKLDIPCLLTCLHDFSGRPNRHDGYQAPYPRLQLFRFILRRYFGLQFAPGAIDDGRPMPEYEDFILSGSNYTGLVPSLSGGVGVGGCVGVPGFGVLSAYVAPVLT